MKAVIAAPIAILVALVLGLALLAGGPDSDSAASPTALAEIPPDLLAVYEGAAATCPGLPWQVLAAIGYTESRHAQGRADPSTGDVDPPILGPPIDGSPGRARITDPAQPDGWAHALGPMQFLSTTWARWGRLAPGRPPGATPSVQNAWDAIYSAAAYLCGDDGRIDDLRAAILSYNHSDAYVETVMAKAADYGMGSAASGAAVDGMFCPVAGPVSFSDDFGAPRSGGRSHQGNDLFAPAGTPTVAIEPGVIDRASPTEQGLGGITIWLRGDSARATTTRITQQRRQRRSRVQAGQVVGYVGNTGNARTTPSHLHFEIHPGGGVAVNPYPTVSSLCGRRR